MASVRPLVAGNWKMHGLKASVEELRKIVRGATGVKNVDLLICPPATLVQSFAAAASGSPLRIGGQDCHEEAVGAHTGDISAEMLADAGAKAVIVGHSERRTDHKETDEEIKAKAMAAFRAKLLAILCVGETKVERDAGATLPRIERQLDGSLPDRFDSESLVVAYEPVWAIGTGRIPTSQDIAEVHDFIRKRLHARNASAGHVRILYGGSVKPGNAAEIARIENVDGALVGGASLKAEDFLAIAASYQR